MRISVQSHLDAFSTFRALDEKGQNWLEANAPHHAQWYGHEFVLPQSDVEAFGNKVLDAGGELS